MTQQQAETLVPGTEILVYGIGKGNARKIFELPLRGRFWTINAGGISVSLIGTDKEIVDIPFELVEPLPDSIALQNLQGRTRVLELVRLQQHVAVANSKVVGHEYCFDSTANSSNCYFCGRPQHEHRMT